MLYLNYPFDATPVLDRVDQHVQALSSGQYYQQHRGAFKALDPRAGKVAEFAAAAAMRSIGLSCTEPDLTIYAVRNKGWGADLQVQGYPLHVKSTSRFVAQDLSWTFNWGNLGHGGRDDLFPWDVRESQGVVTGHTDLSDLVTGVWVSEDCTRATVIWFASWKEVLAIGLRPPLAERLRDTKRCVYLEDLLKASERRVDEDEMVFRYPGGKTKILPLLLQILGTQNLPYREPYFGGGSVGLAALEKGRLKGGAWVNDLDPGIAAVWESIRDCPDDLARLVGAFTPSVEDFRQYRSNLLASVPLPTVERAFQKIAVHQMSYSGLGTKAGSPIGGYEQPEGIRYDIACRWNPETLIRKIYQAHKCLAGVRVTNLDFDSVLGDETPAFVYLDPPYMGVGSDLYQYHHLGADHARLARTLKQCPHTWVLSYDDHPSVRTLYSGYSIFEIPLTYTINGAARKHELLICSPDIAPRVEGILSNVFSMP